MKKVLNIGGNTKRIALPAQYAGFRHILLDIDPKGRPDIVCDARDLSALDAQQFEAVYCSHNLEHYYRHDVPRVLAGVRHVLKEDGFVQIRVPDLQEVMQATLARNLDVEDTLYESPAGPISVLDVLYGYGAEIERSGQDFFAHKTGFTKTSLSQALHRAGFARVFALRGNLEINALAFKTQPDALARSLFNLN